MTRRTGQRAAIGFALAIALVAPGGARAQADLTGATERVRLIQEQARQNLRATEFLELPTSGETQLDVGAWTTLTLLDFRDDDHARRLPDQIERLTLVDARAYAKVSHRDGHKLYARARNLDFEFSTAPGFPQPRTRIQERLEVDLLYADVMLDTARKRTARVGRQFVRAGRGLALSAELDGLGFESVAPAVTARAFFGRSLERDPGLDTSLIGFNEGLAERDFYLAEAEHRTPAGEHYYAFLLAERDQSRSRSAAQSRVDFHYDAEYVGIGTDGRFDPMLHYYLEVMHQSGETLVDIPAAPRVSIDAVGALAGLLYFPHGRWHPLVTLEYGFGSGDPARRSVTNSFGGKLTAESDRNFLPFGVFDGGLALSPRLSNLHVIRLGYQVKPLPQRERARPDLLLGTKISCFVKDEKDGAISDTLASLAAHDVGAGVDVFVGARPVSDLSFLLQYGRFIPGGAYPAVVSDATNRMLATTTLSF